MRHDFPQVDMPTEVLAWMNVTEDILNIYKQSCRLQACIIAICEEGSLNASINLLDYEIKPNDMIVLLPGTIIQFKQNTEKVRLCFVGFSSLCIGRVNLIQSIGDVYPVILNQPIVNLSSNSSMYLKEYLSLISNITANNEFKVDPELTSLAFQTILAVTKLIYSRCYFGNHQPNRKKEICRELIQLIMQHYQTERRAQFYASKLGVSIQHLSTTVKEVTGKNTLNIISYIVIMDAKAKLKSTNMTIQEIAYSLNFPSASFFGKYFKKHVGMTPVEFRNS